MVKTSEIQSNIIHTNKTFDDATGFQPTTT